MASLFVALFLIGLCHPVVDVAMNVEAARIERAGGRRIMSTCHGFWSLGAVIGGLIGAGFAQAGVRTSWHLLIVGARAACRGAVLPRGLPEVGRETGDAAAIGLRASLARMIGLCVFAFGA